MRLPDKNMYTYSIPRHYAAAIFFGVIASISSVVSGQVVTTAKPVVLTVIATDRAGHPVADLQPNDIRVFDEGAQQEIKSFQHSVKAPATVILLDLMNLSYEQRTFAVQRLRESLDRMHSSGPLYVYLLATNGKVYPVHSLAPDNANRPEVDDSSWNQDPGSLLEQALKRVNQVHSAVLRSHPSERFKATYFALSSMEQELSRSSGRKQLLWITYGIPGQLRFAGQGWVDLTPTLRQLAALFNEAGTSIYTLDPSLRLATLNRDGLYVLSGATGGRTFGSSDLAMALAQMHTDASSTYLLDYGPPQVHQGKSKYRSVRITCDRKDVRLDNQQVYVPD